MVLVVVLGMLVLFIDIMMLFQEMLDYQFEVMQKLGLIDVWVICVMECEVVLNDLDGMLYQFSIDVCCDFCKMILLECELLKFDVWIIGCKCFQGGEWQEL